MNVGHFIFGGFIVMVVGGAVTLLGIAWGLIWSLVRP